jgi:hypothetical protein
MQQPVLQTREGLSIQLSCSVTSAYRYYAILVPSLKVYLVPQLLAVLPSLNILFEYIYRPLVILYRSPA